MACKCILDEKECNLSSSSDCAKVAACTPETAINKIERAFINFDEIRLHYEKGSALFHKIGDDAAPTGIHVNEDLQPSNISEDIEFVNSHIEHANTITNNMKFNSHVDLWKAGYVFIDDDNIISDGCYINQNEATAIKWANDYLRTIPSPVPYGQQKEISRDSETFAPLVLRGDPGCGKSSFLKYMLIVHRDIFKKNMVIPSRIELSTIKGSLAKIDNELKSEVFQRTVMIRFARDVFYYIIEHEWLNEYKKNSSLYKSDFFNKIRSHLLSKYKALRQAQKNSWNVESDLTKINNILNGVATSDTVCEIISDLNDASIGSIITFAVNNKFKFLPIYDGFDEISPNDHFLMSHTTNYLGIIGSALSDTKSHYKLGGHFPVSIRTGSVIMLRNNTVKYLNHKWSAKISYPTPTEKVIGSPHFARIIKNRCDNNQYIFQTVNIDTSIINAMPYIYKYLCFSSANIISGKEEKGRPDSPLTSENDLCRVFNGNVRKSMKYFRALLYYIIKKSKNKSRLLKNSSDVFKGKYIAYFSELSIGVEIKHYVYRKIMLIGTGSAFHNAVHMHRFEDLNNIEQVWIENNDRSTNIAISIPCENKNNKGFIDNLFDYSSKYYHANVPNTLIKIRVMQIILYSQLECISSNEIINRLKNYFGHDITCSELRFHMSILVYSELLSVDSISSDAGMTIFHYKIENLGKVMVEQIFYRIEYIEHVVHRVSMPEFMVRVIKNEPISQHLETIYEWCLHSIINCFAFYQYILWVEKIEDSYVNQRHRQMREIDMPNWRIAPQIKNNITSVKRMIDGYKQVNQKKTGKDYDGDDTSTKYAMEKRDSLVLDSIKGICDMLIYMDNRKKID